MRFLKFIIFVGIFAFASEPLIIVKQGNFFAGGGVFFNEGKFDDTNLSSQSGQSLHADHARNSTKC